MTPRRFRIGWSGVSLAVALALTISLLSGLILPIYTDEVGWRFQAARLPFDGGVDRFIAEACGRNTIARPPAFMLPFRYLSAYLNLAFADPAWIRIAGVATALVWLALVWKLVGRMAGAWAAMLRALAFALAGLGVLPLLLVWSRPEQALLVMATVAILIATRPCPAEDRTRSWLAAGGILVAGLAALSCHLKGVVFIPIFLVAAAMSGRGEAGRSARIGAIAILSACAVMALRYWTDRFACPADPILADQLGRQNIGGMILAYGHGAPAALAKAALANLSPLNYVSVTLPARDHMSDWLPPADIADGLLKNWRTAIRTGWRIGLILFGAGAGVAIWSAIRSRRVPSALILAATVAGVTLLWSASQMVKNAYEATIVLPLLVLAGILAVASAPLDRIARIGLGIGLGIGTAIVVAISLASQIMVAADYGPRLWRAVQRPGYVDGQRYSLSPWGYSTISPQIVAAGRMCGIDPARRPSGVLIDDLTYFSYIRSYRPQHRLGVLSDWNGRQRDPIAYLRTKGSQGVVLGCRFLPPRLRAQARAVSGFCCLGPP